MAAIRFPEGQQRSGSSGGLVFSHNRYGAYIRARSIPVNPKTTRQQVIRGRATFLSQYWREVLIETEREAWEVYAQATPMTNKWGDPVHLTGLNHFLRSNSARLEASMTVLAEAPAVPGLSSADYTLYATGSAATQHISIVFITGIIGWNNHDGWALLAYQGSPVAASRRFFGGPWRVFASLIGSAAVPVASPKTIDVTFPIAVGQKCWIYHRVLDATGRLSEKLECSFLVGA